MAVGPASLPLRPPAVCSFCMLFSSLTLSKTKKWQVISYVKFYDLRLLFGTFFDISCRSRDISEKSFLGVVFCKIRGEPGVFRSCILTIVFRRCALPNIQNAATLPKKSISDLRLLAYKAKTIYARRKVQEKEAGKRVGRAHLYFRVLPG